MRVSSTPSRQAYSREAVRKMADLLRAGAAMLSERCPICGLPLFRLKSGEVVCPIHGRVLIVRDEAEYTRAAVEGVLDSLERLAASKIQGIADSLSRPTTSNGGEKLGELTKWLEILERIERVKNLIREAEAQTRPEKKEREERRE